MLTNKEFLILSKSKLLLTKVDDLLENVLRKDMFYKYRLRYYILDLIDNINYIILDNKEILERKECVNNKYKEYMYKIFIINVVKSYEKESNNRCININNN